MAVTRKAHVTITFQGLRLYRHRNTMTSLKYNQLSNYCLIALMIFQRLVNCLLQNVKQSLFERVLRNKLHVHVLQPLLRQQ